MRLSRLLALRQSVVDADRNREFSEPALSSAHRHVRNARPHVYAACSACLDRSGDQPLGISVRALRRLDEDMAHDIFDAVYLASDREHLVKFLLTSGQTQEIHHAIDRSPTVVNRSH